MICPRCDEGEIKQIRFKKTVSYAYLCDFCAMVWPGEKDISKTSGVPLDAFGIGEDREFVWEPQKKYPQ